MNKISLLCLLFLPLFGHAQSNESSLLWRIEGPGLEQPSYLYGTIHLLCKEDLQLTEPLRQAFAATQQLVLELDMDDPGMFSDMQQHMVMTNGGNLKNLMDEEEYATLNQFFHDSVGMGLGLLNRFKPFVLQTFLYPNLLGCNPVSYEEEFVRWAKKAKVEVHGLETIDRQMGVFDNIPYEEQVTWLMEMVDDYDQSRKDLQVLITTYRNQDLDKLSAWMVESMAEYEDYGTLLLDDRNTDWLPKMESFMKDQATFFGVGAGHLGGEKGVLNLLREVGYTVSPISLQMQQEAVAD